jgi:hypothetical protein
MAGISDSLFPSNHVFNRCTPSLDTNPSRVISHNNASNSCPSTDAHCDGVSDTLLPFVTFNLLYSAGGDVWRTAIVCATTIEFGTVSCVSKPQNGQ